MLALNRIEQLTKQIAAEFQPQRIIMFGSYAYGNPTEFSDVDILVILPFAGRPVRKAIEIRSKIDPKIPIDLIVRTPEQVKERLAMNDWFMREIVEKGRTVYEADNS
jgi:uncharacterized protein